MNPNVSTGSCFRLSPLQRSTILTFAPAIVILGASKPEQVIDNLKAIPVLEQLKKSPEIMEEIEAVSCMPVFLSLFLRPNFAICGAQILDNKPAQAMTYGR